MESPYGKISYKTIISQYPAQIRMAGKQYRKDQMLHVQTNWQQAIFLSESITGNSLFSAKTRIRSL